MSNFMDEMGQEEEQVSRGRKPSVDEKRPAIGKRPPVTQRQAVLADKTPQDAAKASKKTTYKGGMWNRTFRLPLEWEGLIKRIFAETKAKSMADVERWLVGRGLQAYYDNGERPEFEETVEKTVVLPYMGG